MIEKIQAVILAGGKGTRLGSLGLKIPKALVKINGKFFLDIIIDQLKKNGINDILILAGYKKEQLISNYQNKKKISIIRGGVNWQTLTRIAKARKDIKGKFFLLMYCDNFLTNFNLKKTLKIRDKTLSNIVFSVVKKKAYQKGPIIIKKDQLIYQNKISSDLTEAGYILINKQFFFKNLNKFKGNKLSNFFNYLSKSNIFTGRYYGKNFFCIENQKLIKETKNFF
jgi:NDP-sugar pyrophosphorylase family protein